MNKKIKERTGYNNKEKEDGACESEKFDLTNDQLGCLTVFFFIN
jgi:hypothetical protein